MQDQPEIEQPTQTPGFKKLETQSAETLYRVTTNDETFIVKIPKHVMTYHDTHSLMVKYIDLNNSMRQIVADNIGKDNMDKLVKIEVIDMDPVQFSEETGEVKPTDIDDETAEPEMQFAVKMTDLTPDASYQVFDPSIFDPTYQDQKEADPVRQAARDYALTIQEEIESTISFITQLAKLNDIQAAIMENTFHIKFRKLENGEYEWTIVPLDYTGASRVTKEEREERKRAAQAEDTRPLRKSAIRQNKPIVDVFDTPVIDG